MSVTLARRAVPPGLMRRGLPWLLLGVSAVLGAGALWFETLDSRGVGAADGLILSVMRWYPIVGGIIAPRQPGRFDAERVAADFALGLRDEVRLDHLTHGLVPVTQQTLRSTAAGVCLRAGNEQRE